MSNIAIRVDDLSKQYTIGLAQRRHDTLRDQIMDSLRSIFRSNGHGSTSGRKCSGASTTIWALKNISFEIKHGEVVGIIGRNGAGKSTLLKILSRITDPTTGRVEIYGRVGSLLEVGTGFHGELTGRENIYLNGAILGMRRGEIENKFDQIVAFAEVEKFIDTPVKRYSSGMYVRLAFAVAAHLEPELLIVDEVLSVGDAAFQRKCLGKMSDVAREGRTVLFVSHNMLAVKHLCGRALLLEGGCTVADDTSEVVIGKYLDDISTCKSTSLGERTDREGDQRLKFLAYQLLDSCRNALASVNAGQDLRIAFRYESQNREPLKNVHVAIGIN
ncbi:MAG: ABC transporter ATP-binding protein, partial [Verrucomicrobia bacterium]